MSEQATASVPAEAEAAFARVRDELARDPLVSRKQLAALALRAARRERYAAFEIEARVVSRRMTWTEAPLRTEPSAPPQPAEPWGTSWPPTRADLVKDEQLEMRRSYELQECPDCEGQGGRVCPDCGGQGFVTHPENPYSHQDCPGCQTKGRLDCGRCRGSGRLIKYPRIEQRVRAATSKLRFPVDGGQIPSSEPSGTLELSQHAACASAEEARAAICARAPALGGSPWLGQVAEALAGASQVDDASGEARLGWIELRGRWFDGWQLDCDAGGKTVTYFAPDGGGAVGPRLHDPRKLGAIAGAGAALLLIVIGAIAISRACGDEEPGLATQIELDEDEVAALERGRERMEAKRRAARDETKRLAAQRRRELFHEAVAAARERAAAPVGATDALAKFREAESFGTVVGADAEVYAQLLRDDAERAAGRGELEQAVASLERAQTMAPTLEGVEERLAALRAQLDAEGAATADRAAAADRKVVLKDVAAVQRKVQQLLKQSQRKMRPLRANADPAAVEACAVYERLQRKEVDAVKQQVEALPPVLRAALRPAAAETSACLTCGEEADAACTRAREALRAARPAIRAYQQGKEMP